MYAKTWDVDGRMSGSKKQDRKQNISVFKLFH